jgi:hypothetical protein
MFARIKKSGPYQYVQIVESRREGPKVRQRVIATVGRLDKLNASGELEKLARSLARFSEQAVLVLSAQTQLRAEGRTIGPALIFGRLWDQLGFRQVLQDLLRHRLFGFDVERAIFTTVLHRLMMSGSDRSCSKWLRDHVIPGTEDLQLHHLYRAMAFLGEETEDQKDATPFSPRCTKDLIEESFFRGQRHLFTGLDLIFFDTTSIYFERLEAAGHSFEWPDIKQDLKALQQITIEEGGKHFAVRTECRGTCGKVFQAIGVAVPPTIRQLEAP